MTVFYNFHLPENDQFIILEKFDFLVNQEAYEKTLNLFLNHYFQIEKLGFNPHLFSESHEF